MTPAGVPVPVEDALYRWHADRSYSSHDDNRITVLEASRLGEVWSVRYRLDRRSRREVSTATFVTTPLRTTYGVATVEVSAGAARVVAGRSL
jgi:hypothetical protein